MPAGCPGDSRTGNAGLRPAGLSSAERISDSLLVWELRGLDATTPVAVRTSHSWEQINAFVTQRADDAFNGQCLSFMGPNSVRNGSRVMSAGGPGPDAYWPWRPGEHIGKLVISGNSLETKMCSFMRKVIKNVNMLSTLSATDHIVSPLNACCVVLINRHRRCGSEAHVA